MRKQLSLALTFVIAAGMLSACGTSNGTESSTAAPGSEQETAASEGETVLRVIDYSDSTATAREEFHKEFEQNHPGVKVEYTCLTPDQLNNTVITMVRSGDGPDIFCMPSGITLAMAVEENWYVPLDDYLDDSFFSTITEDAFEDNITMLNGQIYSIPEELPLASSMIYYNQDVLDAAGVTQLPETYSEFLEVCRQVTEAGQGQFYGWIDGGQQVGRLETLVRAMASTAGGKVPSSNNAITVDGRAPYDSDEIKGVMELFKQLVADGSMHPDTLSISAPEARELFAQGQAAFLCQGMWCIPAWEETYPDLNYGVMGLPVPDGVTPGTYGVPASQNAAWLGIYSQSENKELAAEYIKCLYSEEYSYQAAKVSSGDALSVVTAVNENSMTNVHQQEYYQVAMDSTRVIPVATKRNAQVYDFYNEVHDVEPAIGNIFQGVISGSIDEYDSYLTTLADDSTTEWKRAAEAVGLDFSVFEFPNWDMSKDYTEADYQDLP